MTMSRLSAVHRGTVFEQRSLRLLQSHLSMALRRTGGKADGGIDLVGWWWLPFQSTHRPGALPDPHGLHRRRLRVLAQCKAEKKKFSPKYVREMEGVWHRSSPSPSAEHTDPYPTVALLVSESPFSQSTALHAYRSPVPFLLIHIPRSFPSAGDTDLGTVCPNPTLTDLVKPLAFCWERSPTPGLPSETDPPIRGRPGLWWHGRRLLSWTPDSPEPPEP